MYNNGKPYPVKRQRYTKGQIIRNRIIFALAAAAVLAIIIFSVVLLADKLSGNNSPDNDISGSSNIESSLPDENSEPDDNSKPDEPSKADEQSSSDETNEGSSADESSSEKPEDNPSSESSTKPTGDYSDSPYYEKTMPLLVNINNPIPDGFEPNLEPLPVRYKMDKRAAKALNDMTAAAKQDGITLTPVSAYRSNESQTRNYNNKIKEYESLGYSHEEAVIETGKIIALPGTSEHSLGYAVDLNSLEESFENTKTFKWLIEHCADYGFILRYPKDKTDITKISYEPWHYRYVGINHAKEIMSQGICLEEYVN